MATPTEGRAEQTACKRCGRPLGAHLARWVPAPDGVELQPAEFDFPTSGFYCPGAANV